MLPRLQVCFLNSGSPTSTPRPKAASISVTSSRVSLCTLKIAVLAATPPSSCTPVQWGCLAFLRFVLMVICGTSNPVSSFTFEVLPPPTPNNNTAFVYQTPLLRRNRKKRRAPSIAP